MGVSRTQDMEDGTERVKAMGEELWCHRVEREAAEKLEEILVRPSGDEGIPQDVNDFDPWALLPSLYGSYSSSFDECAIDVLREIDTGKKVRDDLGAEMFREMLCTAHLCSYGTSPRVCFPTSEFKTLLPRLIARWEAHALAKWGEDVAPVESLVS